MSNQQLSIQGEQQAAREVLWASDKDVDGYVGETPDEILECRERGHRFEGIKRTLARLEAGVPLSRIFARVDAKTGMFVRLVGCDGCRNPDNGLARVMKTELWQITQYRGKIKDASVVASWPIYVDPDYLSKNGRMKRKQISKSIATTAFRGQSFKDLRKEIMNRPNMLTEEIKQIEEDLAAAESVGEQQVGDTA